ncbi:MAG: hypothetical protein RL610_1482, partial [Pseudomonadota bacterium]
SKDGNFSMSWNGRLQVASQYNFINDPSPNADYLDSKGNIAHSLPNEFNSGMNIRRARLGAESMTLAEPMERWQPELLTHSYD